MTKRHRGPRQAQGKVRDIGKRLIGMAYALKLVWPEDAPTVFVGFTSEPAPVVIAYGGDYNSAAGEVEVALAMGWHPWAICSIADAVMNDLRDSELTTEERLHLVDNYEHGEWHEAMKLGDPAMSEVVVIAIATPSHYAQLIAPYTRDEEGAVVWGEPVTMDSGGEPGGRMVAFLGAAVAMSERGRNVGQEPAPQAAEALLYSHDFVVVTGDRVARLWN